MNTDRRLADASLGRRVRVRVATAADVDRIAAIGRVGFPAVHAEIVGADFARAVVEQTYGAEALADCVTSCAAAEDALFLVAVLDGDVVGYLHYDCEGPQPELHRIYVDPDRKGAGIGSALMRALHEWLPSRATYVLLVAEANTSARGFYERHGLVTERRVDGNHYYASAMGIHTDGTPAGVPAFLMRYTKP